jgi:hypothetical protein
MAGPKKHDEVPFERRRRICDRRGRKLLRERLNRRAASGAGRLQVRHRQILRRRHAWKRTHQGLHEAEQTGTLAALQGSSVSGLAEQVKRSFGGARRRQNPRAFSCFLET